MDSTGDTTNPTNPVKIRQLTIEQQNAIDCLLQGRSDRSVAEAVGVMRQTVWEWRNRDILFIAELNRQRSEMWREAHERMKSMANRALDVLETQLTSGDPKTSLSAARYVLQGTQLLEGDKLPSIGPTTPEALLMHKLRNEARQEIRAKYKHGDLELFGESLINEDEVESRAKKKLQKALEEAGLA
jgi:hypothetical protein